MWLKVGGIEMGGVEVGGVEVGVVEGGQGGMVGGVKCVRVKI